MNVLQLHSCLSNPVGNLAGAGLGLISENGQIPDLPEPERKSSTTLVCCITHRSVELIQFDLLCHVAIVSDLLELEL